MTNKEIAERLRKIVDRQEKLLGAGGSVTEIRQIADELDPPRPEPGTYVWWRYTHNRSLGWYLGEYRESGVDHFGSVYLVPWSDIEWKPARILADDEVAVKVPPVEEWTPNATAIGIYMSYGDSGCVKLRDIITRAEAEAQEAGR